jgi:hypothetical protein
MLFVAKVQMKRYAAPLLWQLFCGFLARGARVRSHVSLVGFVVDQVVLGQVFHQLLPFSPVSFIHRCCICIRISSGGGGVVNKSDSCQLPQSHSVVKTKKKIKNVFSKIDEKREQDKTPFKMTTKKKTVYNSTDIVRDFCQKYYVL